ncbi:MAG TPA: hypothetical protein VN426_09780 [Syntrophomonadaceae bacterium]|nr:hypothetical protein [Syntrophomonadaceae bacterium]
MRNKTLVAVLTAMMLLFNAGLAAAAPASSGLGTSGTNLTMGLSDEDLSGVLVDNAEGSASGLQNIRSSVIKQFESEFHQIAQLENAKLGLRQQEVEKIDQILSLTVTALDQQDKEALQEARQLRQSIKTINQNIRSLHQQVTQERQAFRQACKNGDLDSAGSHINQVIELMTQINGKLQEKLGIFDQIISTLS